MEYPECLTDLGDNSSGLFWREEGTIQEKVQGISLDIFLQNQMVLSLRDDLQYFGQVGAGIVKQRLIDLCASRKVPQDEKTFGGFMTDQIHTAPCTFLLTLDPFIFFLQGCQEPGIN